MNSKDECDELQTIKRRNLDLQEKIQQWKKQRENICASTSNYSLTTNTVIDALHNTEPYLKKIESNLIAILSDKSLCLPVDLSTISIQIANICDNEQIIKDLLLKFSSQNLINLKSNEIEETFSISSVDHSALKCLKENNDKLNNNGDDTMRLSTKRLKLENDCNVSKDDSLLNNKLFNEDSTELNNDSVECILSLQSAKEKENKKISEELCLLLSKRTAREKSLAEQFRSSSGQVQEFCQHGTREECMRIHQTGVPCFKLHFLKIIQKHTDESLGDCSFLNTCFHMDSCKYVHYKVEVKKRSSNHFHRKDDNSSLNSNVSSTNAPLVKTLATATEQPFKRVLFPPQWIRCDLRFFDMSILGKFAVVMADPPWDIHMELPYGTMSDDEMRNLNIPCLQDEGLIFLWVTGRAMELGRECLKLWGYERCDELIWVKTNQLQRIIRTGRTGHWINHGKEHCLVGVKGNPKNLNRGLDCDVIVAEVRATSHKPDEIYGIIERLSPGSRKIELFGRQHNTQPNWVTLGNQLNCVRLGDPQLIDAYRKTYPDAELVIDDECSS